MEERQDLISRQAAIDVILADKIDDTSLKVMTALGDGRLALTLNSACDRHIQEIGKLPSVQPEQRWILCSKKLPEEDVNVLITYRYKEGKGDISYAYIDITTYGQMYFGGNKVGGYKHWREPFEYFTSNYEVVAWMPLPKPYRGEKK